MLREDLPQIVTETLPGPKAQAIIDRRSKAIPAAIRCGYPVVMDHAEGAMIEDVDGNKFLDWIGGVGVLNIGHCHPEVVEAVKAQADKYFHGMFNVVTHEGYVALAEKLADIAPVKGEHVKAYFTNSGAEADENAVKIAKAFTKRPNIIVFSGAFHGRTLLTMSMTSKKAYAVGMGPFPDGIFRAQFLYYYRNPEGMPQEKACDYYMDSIKAVFEQCAPADTIAAIVVEPLQGEGGFIGVAVGVVVLLTASQSFYSLQEDEYAVVQTFGYAQVVETPGIKFKIPFVQNINKVSKASKQFAVGYDLETDESIDKESFMITSDYNFVNVDFYFEYQISDPIKYFYASEDPETIVKNLAQSYIRDTVGSHKVDEVLTTGKYAIQSEIKTKLQERMDEENIGIQITNAVIQDAEVPTTEVAQAFKNVEDAKQGMETAINNANADANTRIPAANAQADKIIKDTQAEKAALIAEAEGQTARFNSLYEEYIKFPLVTKQRMFYETMEEVLPKMKIYITDGSTQTMLPLDSFSTVDIQSGSGTKEDK